MRRQGGCACVVAALFAAALLAGCGAPGAEQASPESTPQHGVPLFLERTEWPVIFDLPSFGIEHRETAVVTDLTTGHRQYQTNFLSSSLGGAPICCIAQLWVEEGSLVPGIADLPLTRVAESDVGRVLTSRREGAPGPIATPALQYLPFTGSFGGDMWGCFVFLSDVVAALRNGAPTPLVYHGYFCQKGDTLPDERSVAAVMQNLRVTSAPFEALLDAARRGAELYQAGRYGEAASLLEEAVQRGEQEFGPNHPGTATLLNNLAVAYRAQGRFEEAALRFQQALAIREQALGADHVDVGSSLNNLAELYRAQGRYAEAEPLFRRAVTIQEKALGPEHLDVATTLNNLAELYREQGRDAEAEPLYRRSLSAREKALGPDHPDIAAALNNLALLYRARGRYDEAEPLFQRALSINQQVLGPEHPITALALNNLGDAYLSLGRLDEAEPLLQEALAITAKTLGPEHPSMALPLSNLAMLYRMQGRHDAIEAPLRRALAIREKALGPNHPDVVQSLNNLAAFYDEQGRAAEAEALRERASAAGRPRSR